MWTAITAAVVMAGLIWLARIGASVARERQRAEDVAELAELVEQAHDAVHLLRSDVEGWSNRAEAMESKLAAVQSAQAIGRRR